MSLQEAINAANERTLEKSLHIQRPALSSSLIIEHVRLFCRQKGVSLSPLALAAFLDAQAEKDIVPAMESIQAWYAHHLEPDPCSSPAVREVLARRLRIEVPRSWSKEDRRLFAALPPEVRAIIYRRETERDTALRRFQNKAAEGIGVKVELRKFINRSKDQRKD
jgi:hypothetical protein